MKKISLYIILLVSSLAVFSCYKEDAIIPSSSENSDRFTFPQGNSQHDIALKKLYDDFGVKVIYKGFRDIDFNLSWTSPAVGKVGYDIPADQEALAAGFMINHFFAFLKPEITKKVLPPYFYVADSIYQATVSGTIEYRSATPYFYTGLDFWSFCWNGYAPARKDVTTGVITPNGSQTFRPRNSFEYFYRRGVMLKEVFKKAVTIGNIIPPEDFSSGLDFTTAIKYAAGTETDVNYYKKRGFPGQMANALNFNLTNIAIITKTSPVQNFIDYIHLCMRYTADSIEVNFPISKYPIIHQKYPVVIKYMKDNYGIDLTSIATKPTI